MGIIVDEQKAKEGFCKCFDLGQPMGIPSYLCFSKGVIGGLSSEQENRFCKVKEVVHDHVGERVRDFRAASNICEEEVSNIPHGERLEPFIRCMGRELKDDTALRQLGEVV
jgi:hypothetical protein